MIIKTSKPKAIWKAKTILGEGTLWVSSHKAIFFVDIKKKNITSYLKLKEQELKNFSSNETFSKKAPITDWEKINTLDC